MNKKYCTKCGAELIHTTKPNYDKRQYDSETGKETYPRPVYNYYRCPNAGMFNSILSHPHNDYDDRPYYSDLG